MSKSMEPCSYVKILSKSVCLKCVLSKCVVGDQLKRHVGENYEGL